MKKLLIALIFIIPVFLFSQRTFTACDCIAIIGQSNVGYFTLTDSGMNQLADSLESNPSYTSTVIQLEWARGSSFLAVRENEADWNPANTNELLDSTLYSWHGWIDNTINIGSISPGRDDNLAWHRRQGKSMKELRFVIWMQGESDCLAEDNSLSYEDNLIPLIAKIRARTRIPDLKFVLVSIATWNPLQIYRNNVNTAMQNIASSDENIIYVDITDLDNSHTDDDVHYNATGATAVANRIYAAIVAAEW